ncbi:mitotic spindle assembly checkpoint protein MAD2B [Lingula anatina]|uniref:Mitotic spindle assembly checkpoint protein MAD2B n=1 Tax=Lingula anatina TaxID=7574 RepID=A0A1S3JBA3_LINAN|nr:mitotic spindle assembly checkpoint protein MAD2B [Lingula anatina]|eukprot:XP_013407471.1 mitotic spindle assembly checkpoint protein MAD2B [Lingula anatina]
MSHQDFSVSEVSADILCEFLEVAFHCILYVRQVYPPGVFERRKKYNIPVQVSRHPEVRSYIQEVVKSLRPLLQNNELEKVVLVILDGFERPVERFVFEITTPQQPNISDDSFLLRIEQALRSFILKLNICEALLSDKPKDCTWTVQVHTKESAVDTLQSQPLIESFPWVQAEDLQTSMADSRLVPLKAMQTGLVQMQLYAEEIEDKT